MIVACMAVSVKSQTYINGISYKKTFDTEPKLLNTVPYGYLVTIEVKKKGYYISGKFGQGIDTFDLVRKGSVYVDDVKGAFIVVDHLTSSGTITIQSVKVIDGQYEVYDISNLKLSK